MGWRETLGRLVNRWFNRDGANEKTVMDIFKELLPDNWEEVLDLATKVMYALEHIDTDNNGSITKREMVAAVVIGSAKALKVDMPRWVVNGVIEWVIQRVKIPDFSITYPRPASDEDPNNPTNPTDLGGIT